MVQLIDLEVNNSIDERIFYCNLYDKTTIYISVVNHDCVCV